MTSDAHMDPWALMRDARTGDTQAFERIVSMYWPLAEQTAHRLLQDAMLAQDVAQEVFADLYMQKRQLAETYTLAAYITAMARNKSVDMLRRLRRHVPLEDSVASQETQAAESEMLEGLYRGALFAAIEAMPDMHQRMIRAYALKQRSYKDIASELHISVAQVKVTLHRIRKKLRHLREDWD